MRTRERELLTTAKARYVEECEDLRDTDEDEDEDKIKTRLM